MAATAVEPRAGRRSRPEAVALPGVAATAGISYDLASGTHWRIVAVTFRLVAAAGVANRQVLARLLDFEGVPVYAVAAPAVQTAGLTVVYSFAPSLVASGSAALGFMQAPFVGGKLPDNLTLSVTVAAAQAGDAISNVRLLTEQWPNPYDDQG